MIELDQRNDGLDSRASATDREVGKVRGSVYDEDFRTHLNAAIASKGSQR